MTASPGLPAAGGAEGNSHPAHREFVEPLEPHLDKVLVIDYIARD